VFEPGQECENCHKRHVLEHVYRACVSNPPPPEYDRTAARRLIGQIRAEASWSQTEDRPARTAPARRALQARFLREAGGDEAKAEELRRAFYTEMSRKSLEVRRAKACKTG
jgi:hypothetical protein